MRRRSKHILIMNVVSGLVTKKVLDEHVSNMHGYFGSLLTMMLVLHC